MCRAAECTRSFRSWLWRQSSLTSSNAARQVFTERRFSSPQRSRSHSLQMLRGSSHCFSSRTATAAKWQCGTFTTTPACCSSRSLFFCSRSAAGASAAGCGEIKGSGIKGSEIKGSEIKGSIGWVRELRRGEKFFTEALVKPPALKLFQGRANL